MGIMADGYKGAVRMSESENEVDLLDASSAYDAEFIKGLTKKILAAYQAKYELYEEYYQDTHEYGPTQVPNLVLCGPPSSGRTTICRYIIALLNKPALWGNGAAVITSTREWATLGR